MSEEAVRYLFVAAWTVASAVGVVYAFIGAREAHADVKAIDGYPNGRLLNARRDRRNQTGRVLIQASWLIVGILVLLGIQLGMVGLVVLVGTNTGITLLSRFDLRDRRVLMARVDDSIEARFASEMARTDAAQAVQDGRMDAHDVRFDERP